MPNLEEVKHRTTPVGKILGVIEYLEQQEGGGNGGQTTVTWADVQGKPAVIAAGADQAAARAAIGAGTSSLAIGTTADTAAAGNHTHTADTITTAAITGVTGSNVQAVIAELAARIVALESGG
ncbi:hypothetical protein DUZ99_02035 [Xylanibacillus composti]|uniref:Head fiber protein n=1 Tax=Xylanibacillus composti TaxID=1572762 RepID=A0A8J4M3C7_9BACL|nr:hypothetical protein [Xylanibacillus composti]MDT9723774.1 hypothetical protein [Xylanibacillus composti]GIQ70755.1 hypothetical protein XYCOK13_35790 [Xylanibacillus composti]